MFENHPITVPAGSITGWKTLYRETYQGDLSETEYIATQATRWGADQELLACINFLYDNELCDPNFYNDLRNHRRPKPLSLKEQALAALQEAAYMADDSPPQGICSDQIDTIRRALEALDD